jgi:MtN3 and saliva related transmembrane protein
VQASTGRFNTVMLGVLFLSLITLYGSQDLVPHDMPSLLILRFRQSGILGFVAGFGTTFAAVRTYSRSLSAGQVTE